MQFIVLDDKNLVQIDTEQYEIIAFDLSQGREFYFDLRQRRIVMVEYDDVEVAANPRAEIIKNWHWVAAELAGRPIESPQAFEALSKFLQGGKDIGTEEGFE
jgi:hypothetical protein